jgi:hypothetical protein
MHKSRIATLTRMALKSEMMRKPIANAEMLLSDKPLEDMNKHGLAPPLYIKYIFLLPEG